MGTQRDQRPTAARAAARRAIAGEPASVLAARQLAAEAWTAGRRQTRRRARAAVPIRPLTDVCPIAS